MGSLTSDLELEYNSNSSINLLDSEEFRRQGHMFVDFMAEYYKNIDKYPVRSQVEPGYLKKRLPESAPYSPESVETILQDVQEHIVPGITHWQSPNYFAYFPATSSVAGIVGEMLSSGFNVVGLDWISSPAAVELENIVMDWLGQMLDLPKSFLFSGNGGGVIQGTTCEALLCTLTAARDRVLKKIGRENISKLVVYSSDQTHCAFQKAAQIVGIDRKNIRAIKTTKSSSYGLSAESVLSQINLDVEAELIPLFLCATVGTTAITAVDPLKPLCDVAKQFGIWVHVDAAYAGSACICPEFRHFIDGVECVDSFSFNPHKWLFTTLDCCCLWVKDPSCLLSTLSTNPQYLKNEATDQEPKEQEVGYKDWQITLCRRFRSLKLWVVIRNFGVANLRNFIRSHVGMAKLFERLVTSDKRFEVAFPRNFSLVCFRVTPSAVMDKLRTKYKNGTYDQYRQFSEEERTNEFNRELLESINVSGKVFMTHAIVGGIYVLRFAAGNSMTMESHVRAAWMVVQEHLEAF